MYTQEAINVNDFGKLHPFLWTKVNSDLTEGEKVIKEEYFRLIELSQDNFKKDVIDLKVPVTRGDWKRVGSTIIYTAMKDHKRPLDASYKFTAKSKRDAEAFLFDDEDSMLDFWCYCTGRDVEETRQLAKDSNWDGYEVEGVTRGQEKDL